MLRSSRLECRYWDLGEGEKSLGEDETCSDTAGSLSPYADLLFLDEDTLWDLPYIEGSVACCGLVWFVVVEGCSRVEGSRKLRFSEYPWYIPVPKRRNSLDVLGFAVWPGPFAWPSTGDVVNGGGFERLAVKLLALANVRVPAVARGGAFFLIWGPLSELESSESGVANVEVCFAKVVLWGRGRCDEFRLESEPTLGIPSDEYLVGGVRVLFDLFMLMVSNGLNFSPPCVAYGVLRRGSNWTLDFALECLLDGSAAGRSCLGDCVLSLQGGGASAGCSRWVEYALLGAAGSSPPGVLGVKPFLCDEFWLCDLAFGFGLEAWLSSWPGLAVFLGGGAGLLAAGPDGGALSLILSHAS